VAGALYLTIRNRPIAEHELFLGTLQMAKVEPRTVLTVALLNGAATVVLFHDHPSVAPRGVQGESHWWMASSGADEWLHRALAGWSAPQSPPVAFRWLTRG
jgi:hypothetical protein